MPDILEAFPDMKYDEIKKKSLIEWLKWIRKSSFPKMITDSDRFLWEIRNGCWMSYCAQGMDIIDYGKMIQPCNCRLFLSYLFGWPEYMRREKAHQVEIMKYNVP